MTGATVTNAGTISASGQALGTDATSTPLTFYLTNTGAISGGTDALSFSADIGSGTVSITNSGTISAQDGVAIDLAAVTSGTAQVTVQNDAGGDLSSPSGDAVAFGGGRITVTNAGTISAGQGSAVSVTDYAAVTEFHLTNASGGVIDASGDAVAIRGDSATQSGASGTVVVDNSGTILSRGSGASAIDFSEISSAAASVTLNNTADGILRSVGGDAIRLGSGATVNNSGEISTRAAGADAIRFEADGGAVNNASGGEILGAENGVSGQTGLTVVNDGTISGTSGAGVSVSGSVSVINSGTITGGSAGVTSSGDATVINSGMIEGQETGLEIGGGYVSNTSGATISGRAGGIVTDGSAATNIENAGTIDGGTGSGISLVGDTSDTIVTSGRIAGGNGIAISMGGGDDTLTVETGARFVGTIDGGDGTDTVALSGKGRFVGARNFEYLTVSGDWTLTGDQSYGLGTTVTASSTLTLDQVTLGGDVYAAAEGTLSGEGTVDGGLLVDGAVSPGLAGHIGTITVTGNYVQNPGADYAVDLAADGTSDLISVDGTATLGGTATITLAAGIYTLGSSYTILTAAGEVSNSFTLTQSQELPFLDLTLTAAGDTVAVAVARNDTAFASLAVTRNQKATAAALETLGSGTLYNATASALDSAAARAQFDAVSGEFNASLTGALVEDSEITRSVIGARMERMIGGGLPSLLGSGQGGLWLTGYGSDGRMRGDGNAAAISRDAAGIYAGADTISGEWTLGAAFGAGTGRYETAARASSADIDSYSATLYAGRRFGSWAVHFGASQSWNAINSRRDTGLTGLAVGDHSLRVAQIFGEASRGIVLMGMPSEAFFGLARVRASGGSWEETGTAGISYDAASESLDLTTLGLRMAVPMTSAERPTWLLGTLGWRHAFGAMTPNVQGRFSGSDAFTVYGAPISQDALIMKARLQVAIAPEADLGVSVGGQIASEGYDLGIDAGLKFRF